MPSTFIYNIYAFIEEKNIIAFTLDPSTWTPLVGPGLVFCKVLMLSARFETSPLYSMRVFFTNTTKFIICKKTIDDQQYYLKQERGGHLNNDYLIRYLHVTNHFHDDRSVDMRKTFHNFNVDFVNLAKP